jgi:DNA polymerase-1
MKISFSLAAKTASLSVYRPGVDVDHIRTVPGEQKLREEVAGQIYKPDHFTWSGLEQFGLVKESPALVVEILRVMPSVYDGTFNRLVPAYGQSFTRAEVNMLVQAVLDAAVDYGTGLHEEAEALRAGLIDTPAKLSALAEKLVQADVRELAVDYETTPTCPEGALREAIGDTRYSVPRLLSLSTSSTDTYLIDCDRVGQDLSPLGTILERCKILCHNLQFDWAFFLDCHGVQLGRHGEEMFATLTAARVLSNEAKLIVFEDNYRRAVEYLGDEMLNPKDLPLDEDEDEDDDADDTDFRLNPKPRGKKQILFQGDLERTGNRLDQLLLRFLGIKAGLDMSTSDWSLWRLSDRQLVYAARDSSTLFPLRDAILAAADEEDRTIIDLDLAVLRVCLNIYKYGLPMDVPLLNRKLEERRLALVEAQEEAYQVLPGVNFGSSPACIKALGELGIFVESVDKGDLARFLKKDTSESAVVRPLLLVRSLLAEVRDLELKFLGHLRGGAVHGMILPSGAGTGRCSSRRPNLQNIKRAPDGEVLPLDPGVTNFRELVRAPDGWKIIVADYNQMELRAAAVVAKEENMLSEFSKPKADLHTKTARGLDPDFDKLDEKGRKKSRNKAKALNFGLLFGMKPAGFQSYAAKSYGLSMSLAEATEMRSKWLFRLYPAFPVWHADALFAAKSFESYGKTLLGRKRRIHPRSEELGEWWAGFQAHTNHVIQGSCADVMKLALVRIDQELDPQTARILSVIHDELLVLVRDDMVETIKILVKKRMEEAAHSVFGTVIPFPVNVDFGQTWACKS